MKVCFIPPKGLERRMGIGGQVLCLAPLAHDGPYVSAVREAASNGIPITMDNGIAEGIRLSPQLLVDRFHYFGADELVVPDVLGDARGTLDRVTNFIGGGGSPRLQGVKLMAVIQGRNMFELERVASNYSRWGKITTVGIPRLLGQAIGKEARINLALHLNKEYPGRFEIHFLGAQADWPGEVLAVSKETPFVRSFDTSLPYNYAMAGRQLRPGDPNPTTPTSRPSRYFRDDQVLTELIKHNEAVIKTWANAGIL